MSNVEVRMVQEMSGARGDGQAWPPVGGVLTVSAAEAAQLCSTAGGTPIAVPVVSEERRTETGDAPDAGKTETRVTDAKVTPPAAEVTAAAPKQQAPPGKPAK